MSPRFNAMKRTGWAAILAACMLPVIIGVGAWRSGIDAFAILLIAVIGSAAGWALIALPDRRRAHSAIEGDRFRGSALLDTRDLRRTDAFKETFKHSRTGPLIHGQANGDLSIGDSGIVWRPGNIAKKLKIPQVRISREELQVIRIVPAPGIREPASVAVIMTDGTGILFTINRYRDLERNLAKGDYTPWTVIR
jgi:hypothetical protein